MASRALLFLPVAALLGFTLWQRSAVPDGPLSFGEPDEPLRTGAVGSIDGWEARVPREGASPLRVRLERLHPESGRQSFDASALAGALGLPERGDTERTGASSGDSSVRQPEPWRLTLSVAPRPGPKPGAVVVGQLRDVALEGFVPAVEEAVQEGAAGSGANDGAAARNPLATLLSFPNAPLRAGEACALVFWGVEPEGPVRAEIPGVGPVELLPSTRTADQSSSSIARLDVRDAGSASDGEETR